MENTIYYNLPTDLQFYYWDAKTHSIVSTDTNTDNLVGVEQIQIILLYLLSLIKEEADHVAVFITF